MSVLKTSDNDELIIMCSCGCGDSLHIKVDKEDGVPCFYQSYMNYNWYSEQKGFASKLKKIWRILANRDYYYSEICLSQEDWEKYKEWVNSQ